MCSGQLYLFHPLRTFDWSVLLDPSYHSFLFCPTSLHTLPATTIPCIVCLPCLRLCLPAHTPYYLFVLSTLLTHAFLFIIPGLCYRAPFACMPTWLPHTPRPYAGSACRRWPHCQPATHPASLVYRLNATACALYMADPPPRCDTRRRAARAAGRAARAAWRARARRGAARIPCCCVFGCCCAADACRAPCLPCLQPAYRAPRLRAYAAAYLLLRGTHYYTTAFYTLPCWFRATCAAYTRSRACARTPGCSAWHSTTD